MTTPADDLAAEGAFEALLAGRAVPEEAAGLAAFAGAVRAGATQPGRPNAALAELLATGLLTDQNSPSTRTAVAAGNLPSRRPRVRRRRFAMILPALLAKFLAAGAVAQAATGAGIVVVAFTGAGAAGVLGDDVQHTITSAVGATDAEPATDGSTAADGSTAPGGDDLTSTDPGAVTAPAVATTVPVTPEFDVQAWIDKGPKGYASFGAWVSDSAHNTDLRAALRAEGKTFGSMVRDWAHKKGLDDSDLAGEGVDLDELTDDPAITEPTTTATGTETESETDTKSGDSAESSHGNSHGNGNGGGHGNSGGNGKSGKH